MTAPISGIADQIITSLRKIGNASGSLKAKSRDGTEFEMKMIELGKRVYGVGVVNFVEGKVKRFSGGLHQNA